MPVLAAPEFHSIGKETIAVGSEKTTSAGSIRDWLSIASMRAHDRRRSGASAPGSPTFHSWVSEGGRRDAEGRQASQARRPYSEINRAQD
jgi:hypothetical protein